METLRSVLSRQNCVSLRGTGGSQVCGSEGDAGGSLSGCEKDPATLNRRLVLIESTSLAAKEHTKLQLRIGDCEGQVVGMLQCSHDAKEASEKTASHRAVKHQHLLSTVSVTSKNNFDRFSQSEIVIR